MSKACERCGKSSSWLSRPLADGKICNDCWAKDQEKALQEETAAGELRKIAETEQRQQAQARTQAASQIILTTETAHNLPVADRLDIVTAEVVIGMNLFKDIFSAFSDTFGGRSKTMQEGLRQARQNALTELRREAHALGADAVVGVDLDYSEISGGGKSMLFLVASGTAVTLHKAASA
ncbi:YbjQ family protein [Gemmobacter fulvus]|uniref:YbjQ family protein n=1 Tax=Gemmobacter fulvus TaxID=2840474 RepID=UPI002796AD61|nr:YbjQ family protein [Gemmobacter fulvus]MDQ1847698.1 YbjQ family protein [Gemmobacter fulvus]